MCGVFGILHFKKPENSRELENQIVQMGQSLRHRGPDSDGLWLDDAGQLAFGHRRLAILDLSPLGAQPMRSHSGRFWISFNGECYNFVELRSELETLGHRFKSTSDTEVLLQAFKEWGIDDALARFNGMFAIALADLKDRKLYLIRDRAGEKPLYYFKTKSFVAFASEIKAFYGLPDWTGEWEDAALKTYFELGFVSGRQSVFKNVFRVPPASIVRLSIDQASDVIETKYWKLPSLNIQGDLSEADVIHECHRITRLSVQQQLRSDVPVGLLLSGGIDSSLVASIACEMSPTKINSYTLGFEDPSYDESQYAKNIANHLGSNHHEIMLSSQSLLGSLERVLSVHDEPFADPSQFPTLLIAELASKNQKLVLTGDGGDELFLGYSHYKFVPKLWRSLSKVPSSPRSWICEFTVRYPELTQAILKRIHTDRNHRIPIKEKLHSMRAFLSIYSERELYHEAFYQSSYAGGAQSLSHLDWLGADLVDKMSREDFEVFLSDCVLSKVDRASMSRSLETRAPLLHYRLIELAYQIPTKLKMKAGGKYPLKKILEQYLPNSLWNRPKMGFSPPLRSWLRGPLKDWAHTNLSEIPSQGNNAISKDTIDRLWNEFITEQADHSAYLWRLIVFNEWRRRHKSK